MASAEAGFSCDLDACCTPFCDLNAPPSCPMNFTCTPAGDIGMVPAEPAMSYLRIRVPGGHGGWRRDAGVALAPRR